MHPHAIFEPSPSIPEPAIIRTQTFPSSEVKYQTPNAKDTNSSHSQYLVSIVLIFSNTPPVPGNSQISYTGVWIVKSGVLEDETEEEKNTGAENINNEELKESAFNEVK